VWLVRNRNGIVTFVENSLMAFPQFSPQVEKGHYRPGWEPQFAPNDYPPKQP
jgi:hypothetical protein